MGQILSKILEVPVEEAVKAIAIQLTNGFEVNLPSMSGRAIYPIISYVNHSCVPNVAHSHKIMGAAKHDHASKEENAAGNNPKVPSWSSR